MIGVGEVDGCNGCGEWMAKSGDTHFKEPGVLGRREEEWLAWK